MGTNGEVTQRALHEIICSRSINVTVTMLLFLHKYDVQNIGAERGLAGYISNGTPLPNLN